MKKLEAKLREILDLPEDMELLLTEGEGESPIDIIKKIMEAVGEYIDEFEAILCMLLEFIPDGELSLKRVKSETCTLVYILRKE